MSRKSYIAKTPLYTSTMKYMSIRTVAVTSMSRIPACWGLLVFFSWRRVNSLGSHSLFLGLNYPINQEIAVGKDLDGREALFAMENCVYTASPRSSGENSPDCQRYSLQPKEGENDKGIWINFDPWISQLRQAVMWFKPSG